MISVKDSRETGGVQAQRVGEVLESFETLVLSNEFVPCGCY